jgi:hypothetical protein
VPRPVPLPAHLQSAQTHPQAQACSVMTRRVDQMSHRGHTWHFRFGLRLCALIRCQCGGAVRRWPQRTDGCTRRCGSTSTQSRSCRNCPSLPSCGRTRVPSRPSCLPTLVPSDPAPVPACLEAFRSRPARPVRHWACDRRRISCRCRAGTRRTSASNTSAMLAACKRSRSRRRANGCAPPGRSTSQLCRSLSTPYCHSIDSSTGDWNRRHCIRE